MALEKQMELFDDGGLLQEGGSVDEESGNEVPVGSLKKEVRDDIPAQLSEGEFVMPADVVRYHGLDKMMALRDEAKMGLQRMEDMGQMGNADEAIIPDGVPFTIIDLEIADDEDEPVEMQVGGFVQPTFTPGGVQQSQFAQYQPQFTPYQMPDYTQPTMPAYTPPQQAAVPMASTNVPQFGQFVTPTYVTYVNDAGNTIQIPVGPDGNPLIPVPAGYKKQDDSIPSTTPDTEVTPVSATPAAPPQPEEDPSDGREFGGGPAGLTMNQSKRAVLEQLDPAFASQIKGIQNKYKTPDGLAGFNILGGIAREFQEGSEIRKALSGYDYDKLAADRGLTREELDDVLGDLTQEVFTGYRDPVTGVVSGQKPSGGFKEQLSRLFGSEAEPSGDSDDLGTAPTATAVDDAVSDVSVETTQTLAEAGDTAADAARDKVVELRDFQKNLGLSDNQSLDMLVALTQGDTGFMTFPTPDNPEGQRLDFSQFSDESRVAAQTIMDAMLNKGTPELKGQVAAAVTKYNIESASRDAEDRSAAEAAKLQADIKRAEERRAALEAIQAAERDERRRAAEAARLQAQADEAARKAEQARQAQILEEQRRRQESQTSVQSTPDPSRGEGSSDAARSYSMNQSSGGGRASVGSFSQGDFGGGRGFVGGFEKGGLATKKKPKTKKMKQGGLASKK